MERYSGTENFSPGFCEYLVPGFAGKNMILLRILAVFGGIAASVFLFLMLSFIPQVFFIWLIIIVALEIIVFRLTKREFEYTVATGEFSAEIIYGRSRRRRVFNTPVRDIDRVFPIDSHKDERVLSLNADRIINLSRPGDRYNCCMVVKDKGGNGKVTAVLFSSCNKLLDCIKYYNRSAVTERRQDVQ